MNYYKIIKNDRIIDAGFNFIKWNNKHLCFFLCDIDLAEFALSSSLSKMYYDSWLNPCSNNNIQCETVKIIIINHDEYEEIIELLNNENLIPILPNLEENSDNNTESNSEPEPEPVMTVSEMRSKIILQLLQINMLTDCLLEMSEIIYA